MQPTLRASDLLIESVEILGRNLVVVVGLAAIFLSPGLVYELVMWSESDRPIGVGLLMSCVQLTLSLVLVGPITHVVHRHLAGVRVGPIEALKGAWRRGWSVVGGALLASAVLVCAYLALIIPGIVLACILFAAIPAMAVEGTGAGRALSRSASLTKSSRGTIFIMILLYGGLVVGAAFGAGTVSIVDGALGAQLTFVIWLMSGSLAAILQAVAYFRLRELKEGCPPDQVPLDTHPVVATAAARGELSPRDPSPGA